MIYVFDDYRRDDMPEIIAEILAELSLEERLRYLSPEQVMKYYKPEERLKGLSPEERLQGLSQYEIETLLENFIQQRPVS